MKKELNDWYESLRFRVEVSSAIVGVIYGAVTLLIFGPMALGGPKDWGILHLFISILGPCMLSLFVYHNIWIRQLSLPGALVGVFYSYSKFHGQDLYLYLNLCGLIVVTRIVTGLVEAHATTGKFTDFWRSFLFHPLNWAKHFGIRTIGGYVLESTKVAEQKPVTGYLLVEGDSSIDTKKCPYCAEKIKFEAKVCRYCGHQFDEAEIVKIEKYVQAHNLLKEKQPKIRKMKLLFKFYRIVGGFFFVFGGLFVILVLTAIFKVPETHTLSLIVFGIFSPSFIFLGIFMFRKMKKVKTDYMKIKEEIEELAATGR